MKMVRKSAIQLLYLLALATILAISGIAPAQAGTLPENLPADPWTNWLPPNPSSDTTVLSIPGSLTLQDTVSSNITTTRVNIAQAYFTDTDKTANTQFIAQNGWYLVIQVNMPGQLYLYEYGPPDSIPRGRWIGYNTPIGEGTWQIGPFYARPMEPEGEHVWKVWMFSKSEWATGISTFSYLRKEYTSAPEITFTVEPSTVKRGEPAMLEWNVTGAATIDVQPGIGRVGPSGKRKISPEATTTYTITATNNIGPNTRTVDVTVAEGDWMPAWLIWTIIAGLAVTGGVVAFLMNRRKAVPAAFGEGETALQQNPTMTAAPPTVTRSQTAIKTVVKTKVMQSETAMAEGRLVLQGGKEILLSTASKWIGRADCAGLVPGQDDSFISRQHMLITYEGGEYFVEDGNSGNGTKLNGVDIKGKGKQRIKDGDRIELAEVLTVTFRRS